MLGIPLGPVVIVFLENELQLWTILLPDGLVKESLGAVVEQPSLEVRVRPLVEQPVLVQHLILVSEAACCSSL